MKRLQPLALALCLAVAYPAVHALPQGAQVVQGQVAIQPGQIQQGSDKAIVNWQSFSIAAGERLRIQQPTVNSVLLNRVVGGDPSLILGQMQANGRVFLINPRGIVFGRGSQVDAGGLVASTLDLSDTQFLAANYRFSAGAGAGSLQADGNINAPGGTVALVAPQLNMSGSIAARRVGLAAASTVQVDVEGDGLVLFNLRNDDGRDVALKFNGRVQADGSAELRAQARAGAAGQVLNMDGIVQARGLRQQGGRIVIDGGTAGITTVHGGLDASGETGGAVTVLGQKLALLDGARLDASGRLGGGSLQVGGGFHGQGTEHNAERTWIGAGAELRADATERGDGGSVAIWADQRTDFHGSIWARGGRLGGNGGAVETSGRQQLNVLGRVDASAPQGQAGLWLLDPNDVVIKANGGNSVNVNAAPNFSTTNDSAIVDAGALQNALSGGTVVTVETTSAGTNSGSGNIDVQTAIVPTGPATLKLIALGNISFTGGSIGAGAGALDVILQAVGGVSAGSIDTGGGSLQVSGSGAITLGTVASSALTINGGSGTVTLPGGNVTGALTVSTGGTILQGGALTVGGVATLTTAAAPVTLGNLGSHGLSVTTSNGAITLGSGLTSGNLSISSGGALIGQTGALTVTGTASFDAGAGAITLSQANDFQDAVTLTGGAIRINSSALKLGAVSAAGSFDATTTGGDIHQLVSLVATSGVTLDAGGGDISLSTATLVGLTALTSGTGAITQTGSLTVNGAATLAAGSGGVSLSNFSSQGLNVSATAGSVTLGVGSIAGPLVATTTGSGTITQAGALDVNGAATLSSASGAITLVGFSSGGNVNISSMSGTVTLGAGNIAGTLTVVTGGAGAITQAGNGVAVGGLATLTAGSGGVTLGSFDGHGLSVTASGGGVTLGTGVISGNLNVSSGGTLITQAAGGLTVTGTSSLNAGAGAITLNLANDLQDTVTLTGAATQISSSKTAASVLKLGTSNINGALTATTGGGAITQTGTLTVSGNATLDAGSGAITLAGLSTGQLHLSSTAGNLTLGTGTVSTLNASTAGSGSILQQAGGLTVTGAAVLSAGNGAITLGSFSSGNFNATTGGGALTLGTGTITGTLSAATSGGVIDQAAGGLTVTTTSNFNAGAGDITLGQANDLHGAITLTGRTVQLTNTGSNALTLTSVATTGNLALSTGGGAIVIGPGTVTGTLSASSSGGNISQSAGSLSVNGLSTLNAGAGSITLGSFSSGGLSATTAGGALTLGTGNINGTLTATTAGGLINQASGGLVVTGLANLSAGSAVITLNDAGNDWQGAVTLTGGPTLFTSTRSSTSTLTLGTLNTGNLTVSTAGGDLNFSGGGIVNGWLDARSHGGDIKQGGALSVASVATLDATTSGNVTLGNTGNQWHGLHLAGKSLDVQSGSDLEILSLVQPGNSALTLRAGGNLILGPAASINTGTADLSLASGGSFTMGGVLAGRNVELEAQSGLILGQNITASGTLKLTTAGGNINQTGGSLLVTGDTTVSANGTAITLNRSTNHFGGAVNLSGGTVSVTDSGALTLGTLATGNLTVTSNGNLSLGLGSINGTLNANSTGFAITQSGNLSLMGAATLHAGTADITLNRPGNNLQGAITATGGAVSLRSAGDLNLFALTQPGNRGLELEAGGNLVLPAGTSNIATGTEALTLSSGGVFSTFGTLQGGVVTLKGQSVTLAHNVTASSGLVVTSTDAATGTINQTAGIISVAGATSFNAAGNQAITLNSAANQFTGPVSLTGGNTLLRGQGALVLGPGSIVGTLGVTSGGTITQSGGALGVTGAASFNAGANDITLGNANNSWGSTVALTGKDLQFNAGSAVMLGNVNGASLALTSVGAVSQGAGATLVVTGAIGIDAGNAAITLANNGNQLGGTVTLKGGATQLKTSGALTLGALDTGNLTVIAAGVTNMGHGNVAGTLSVTSGNSAIIQAAGGLNVSGNAVINAGLADITLDNAANAWNGVVALTGRDVRLTSTGAMGLGSLSIRSLVLKTGGAVTQSSPLSLTGALNVDAGNATITLSDGGNQFGGLVTLKGGATQIRTSGALSLGSLDTGNLTVTGVGAMNLGLGQVAGDLVADSGNGSITQTAALVVTGAANFKSGTGNIVLSNSGNQFNGALSLSGNAVTIYNQPSLVFGTLSFNSLDATSNGSIVLGSGSLSGGLTARALGGSITQIAGGLTVAGNATLQASTGITMTEANHLNGTVSLSGGNSAITNAGNLRLGNLATAGLTLDVTGTLDLGGGTVGGTLTAVSSGAISQTGALSVTGATSLNAGSAAITLGQAGNSFAGSVDLRGGNAVITSAGSLGLGSLNVAGLTASSSGNLRLGTGAVGGDLSATGSTLTQASGGLAVSGASSLNAGSGAIDLPEANAFAGAVSLVGRDVTLVNAGALRLGSFSARDLKVSAGGDLDLGGGALTGELTATTRGSKISQSAAMTVNGVANFIADGSEATLVLDQPGNQLLGGISMRGINGGSFGTANISSAQDLSFSGDVKTLTLNSGGVLTLGGGHSTTLTAGAAKSIRLTGPLEVSGLMTLIANGGTAVPVDMAGAGNDFNRVELKAEGGGSFGRVQLRDGDATRHDGLQVSGDAAQLEVTSAGALDLGGGNYGSLMADTAATGAAIKQSGALVVSGLTTLKAGAGDITLTHADNRLPRFTVESAGIASLSSLGDYVINASSVSKRLELGGAGAISLVGPLSGAGELVMKGTGSLTMTTAQTYGGGTRIESGTVVLQGASAQAGSGAVELGAGGQLDLRDGAVMSAELVAQGGKVLSSSGNGGLSGPVTLQAFTRFQPGAGGLTLSGPIDDGGAGFGIGLVGSGTLTLSGNNRYSGVTDIASGTLRATGVGSLSAASAVQLADGAVLSLGLDQTAGSLSGAGRIELGSFILATGADGSNTGFSGSLIGSGGLTKVGSGRFTLSGHGVHTGPTRVAAGELVLASATALNEVTAVTVDDGATLTVQQSLNVGSLAGAGIVDVQAPLLGVGSNGSSTRWVGNIIGSGGLAKLGSGVFTLAGHNTLAGDLAVHAGTLQLEGSGVRPLAATGATGPVVPTTAGVDVAGGALLELLTDIDLGALTGAGQVQLNANTLTVGASGRSGRFDGAMAGSGGLTKSGSGTLALGGANLFTGSTRVSGGLLVLDAAQALAGAGTLVIETPGQVQANALQAVASLSGNGALVLNGASLAAGAGGSDSRFDGVVSGSGGLVKQGAGTLTLTAAHTNSGATVIEAGTVQLSGNGALGSGEIQNQGELRLSRSDALTLDQAISGRGSLVITQGQVTLNSAANSYSGATQVQGGGLITTAADRLSDASAVQVAAGAQLQLGGNETIAALQAAGSVKLAGNLTTQAEQVYTGSLTLSNTAGQTLTGTLIDASRSNNQFGAGPLGLSGGQALVTVKESLQLGDVTLSNGGRIEADRLALNGKMQLSGGSLALVARAAPDDAKATLQGNLQVPVAGQPVAIAEATVLQGGGSTITLADSAKLEVQASGGGSVRLAQDANSFKGQLSVLSGAAFNTAWLPNAKGGQAVQSEVRVSGQQVMVGGSGIEADLVYLRADQLATAGDAKLVARMPFDEIVLGKALSAPGMVLELAPGAFGTPDSFGSVNGKPIQIQVGSTETGNRTTGPNAGYVSVLPKAGAQGSTAVVLVGPKVGSQPASGGPAYRFFHDGASQATEIPVVYNGVLPLTPAASGALSSINGDAEDARRARFQETVRTENVTVRLRSGVIAEVGPGRPSTQGSEGAKPPELCDPAAQPALSCKPANP